jgi:hypothetical protein
MATLTYDPTPADQPEFSEAEQEAIKIGEEAIAEQQQLLAGKFEDAQALEQAYIELQKKLGEPRDEVQASDEGQEEAPAEEEVEEQPEEESSDLTEEQAQALQNIAGGPEGYNEMLAWAGENLSKEEIEMFDSVVGTGNANSCYFAISALYQRYTDAVGSEKPLVTGRGTPNVEDVFRSQAEVVKAMSDPRYDRDPAYRQDVFNKLERSNLNNY